MTRTNKLTPFGSVPDLASYDHIPMFLTGGKDRTPVSTLSWRLVPVPHGSRGTITTWTAPAPR
jgi:hypothetical protein